MMTLEKDSWVVVAMKEELHTMELKYTICILIAAQLSQSLGCFSVVSGGRLDGV